MISDEYTGYIPGFRCHDGFFTSVSLLDQNIVRLGFRRLDGSRPALVLNGVARFALDRFLEGNIVDAAYLWPMDAAPLIQLEAARIALGLKSHLTRLGPGSRECLFVLECSYGATVFSIADEVVLLDEPLEA